MLCCINRSEKSETGDMTSAQTALDLTTVGSLTITVKQHMSAKIL